jgi:hypothetical protein
MTIEDVSVSCDEQVMRKALSIVLVASFVALGCKKDSPSDNIPPPPHPDPAPTSAGTPAPAAGGGAIDANAVVGTWTKADNPKITWKLGSDGSFILNTPAITNNKGTYKLAGNALETKGDGLPAASYKVLDVSAHKMTLDDTSHGMKLEFTK